MAALGEDPAARTDAVRARDDDLALGDEHVARRRAIEVWLEDLPR